MVTIRESGVSTYIVSDYANRILEIFYNIYPLNILNPPFSLLRRAIRAWNWGGTALEIAYTIGYVQAIIRAATVDVPRYKPCIAGGTFAYKDWRITTFKEIN